MRVWISKRAGEGRRGEKRGKGRGGHVKGEFRLTVCIREPPSVFSGYGKDMAGREGGEREGRVGGRKEGEERNRRAKEKVKRRCGASKKKY